ncbi:5'-methylthioadenosine/S-adenosylhomocysteine nucleosidase [Lentibacillus amyloliquefaciens]|uniref:5'-methylthioadenosine/S-adenosylhomocysteine nucleosidase n=1 Tax=Lentibacillus amyloliquefaciens TaxID=1472767 RepID=A0A0U4FCE3_9BACI|nr:5'-methylthioadenosine/S-adenosylhomocysteine nucleosidase [Lentibacillus amyloliquefaciens]ALX48157.1 5'-methylthioadenosine nucleosidase [Lentibacillus amyloliquefaciens]
MTLGIIGAMDEEISLLKENMTDRKEYKVANCLFIRGKLAGREAVLLKSGIGKVNAAMATAILHEQFQPSQVFNTGSAGGFADDLNVGDLVISTHVVHHDVDVTDFGYAYGQVPDLPAMFAADTNLVAKATQAVQTLDIHFREGMIATGDAFMENPEAVKTVRARFPAMIAAEMEAAAIAQVCYQYDTPFVIIRALSDIAGKESSVSFDEFLETAAGNAANLIMAFIRSL